jgi:hypothetical protein
LRVFLSSEYILGNEERQRLIEGCNEEVHDRSITEGRLGVVLVVTEESADE